MDMSPYRLEKSILRIVCADGSTAGTGFVIAAHLAVTCAHVVEGAKSGPGQPIHVHCFGEREMREALVLSMGWSSPEEDDVAFLHLDALPVGITPVIFGLAHNRIRHPYTTFGYAPLGSTQARFADGYLHGVLPAVQENRHDLLQLDGNLVDKGLSGSPILDLQTHRVVGMINEFQNDAYTRVAWATTTETIVQLLQGTALPAVRLWPDGYGPDERDDYLEQVIRTSETLRLPLAYKDIPLECIYISLRTDEMNREERQAERLSLDDVLAQDQRAAEATDPYARYAHIREQIARNPTMFMLNARHWPRTFGTRETEPITVAELVQRHQRVVILGDPGSGKTTVGKWLVLQHARAARAGLPSVIVPAETVQPGHEEYDEQEPLDLGPTCLPIFISIAMLSTLDTPSLLESILRYDCASGKPPVLLSPAWQVLRRDALYAGEALLVLDGLDEVQSPVERREIMLNVLQLLQGPPDASARWQQNRMLLTSRLVGYQYAPLIELAHYTVEGMDEEAITAFCHTWIQHVAGVDAQAVAEQAEQLLDAVFDEDRPGIGVLASNPLLLTILAQVYWQQPQRGLPATRVALFKQATQALYRQRKDFWRSARITEQQLEQALGQVAFDIQQEAAMGLMVGGNVRRSLRRVLPDAGQAEAVLEAAREVAGFLMQKGEGIYGFLHRSLQEYFVAQYFAAEPDLMLARMQPYLWNPTWRVPLILATGIISDPGHPGWSLLSRVFACFLETPDPLGQIFPRGALLAAAACEECAHLPNDTGEHIAGPLLACYADQQGRGASRILRERIQEAFGTLKQCEAAQPVERLLCRAVQHEQVELRFAAVDLVISTMWQSSALVNALLACWRTYAAPSALLLVALWYIWRHQPAHFKQAALPMRRLMSREPKLWTWTMSHPQWREIVRRLYVPPKADLVPTAIYLDSPLTSKLETALRLAAYGDVFALADLRQELRSLTLTPGTPEARDAALILCTLGETSWIDACLTQVGEQLTPILSIVATLVYTYVDTLNLDVDFDLPNIAFDLELGLDPFLHLGLLRPRIDEIREIFQACCTRWPSQQQYTEETVHRPLPLSMKSVESLVSTLASGDDEQREQARNAFDRLHQASALGQEVIEWIAQHACTYVSNPLIGTQLIWALRKTIHDQPVWICSWVEHLQAQQEPDAGRANMILSNLYRVTPETFAVLLDLLPHASSCVNTTLLHALRWQLSLQDLSKSWDERLQTHLLAWLKQEKQSAMRTALIETLGHWQGNPTLIVDALLKRAKHLANSNETASLWTAMARLAAHDGALFKRVREILYTRCPQPSAAAALTRLEAVGVRKKAHGLGWTRTEMAIEICDILVTLLPGAAGCLTALLDAGTDDDAWDTFYHGVLVDAAQRCIERSPDLLAPLLHTSQQALQGQPWPVRRIKLATLAACAEVMPKTLRRAAQSYLPAGVTLEDLLVQGAVDAESLDVRRFALTALSYLGTVTERVVPALLVGCQDSKEVQHDAIAAASRFQTIEGDVLTPLIATLKDEATSAATVYALIRLLAAVGTSSAGRNVGLHTRIAQALVGVLNTSNSQRTVRLYRDTDDSYDSLVDKGSLADALYTALLQITEGSI